MEAHEDGPERPIEEPAERDEAPADIAGTGEQVPSNEIEGEPPADGQTDAPDRSDEAPSADDSLEQSPASAGEPEKSDE